MDPNHFNAPRHSSLKNLHSYQNSKGVPRNAKNVISHFHEELHRYLKQNSKAYTREENIQLKTNKQNLFIKLALLCSITGNNGMKMASTMLLGYFW